MSEEDSLVRIVRSSTSTLIAWDYSPRIFKKSSQEIKKLLEANDIKSDFPQSPWPHISVCLATSLSEEEERQIKMVAPVYKSAFKFEEVEVFEGLTTNFSYVVLKLSTDQTKYVKFYEFIEELIGDRIIKPPSYPVFKPHVSILTTSKQDHDKAEFLLPEMNKIVKPIASSYTPEFITIWKKFQIDSLDTSNL